ncbi:MAG: glucose-1-phosphate cytidylyltransferase [Sedimenticola sp.]
MILAGGYGSRLSEETMDRPKPMVEIGGRPILWHIMKTFSLYGYNEFVLCLGYKGHMIKEYFSNYFLHLSDITVDLSDNTISYHRSNAEPWQVTMVDTGIDTMTGGRIKRVERFLDGERFMMTYGDGLINMDLNSLVSAHVDSGKRATVTAVQPRGRFGALTIGQENTVDSFLEKPKGDGDWINGGFFVLEPEVLDYIDSDASVWEQAPLENLAAEGELNAYRHTGFWMPMDTLRDKRELDEMCRSGNAPWMIW